MGKAVIPYQVLTKLNYKSMSVCVAAKEFLEEMYNVPCITMSMFAKNKKIEKNKKIKRLKKILFQLKYIKTYLNEECKDIIYKKYDEYKHWMIYDGLLSLKDCVDVLSKNILNKLEIFSEKLQKHIVNECNVCKLKGNQCGICQNENDMIYIFQYENVVYCKECQSCFL